MRFHCAPLICVFSCKFLRCYRLADLFLIVICFDQIQVIPRRGDFPQTARVRGVCLLYTSSRWYRSLLAARHRAAQICEFWGDFIFFDIHFESSYKILYSAVQLLRRSFSYAFWRAVISSMIASNVSAPPHICA